MPVRGLVFKEEVGNPIASRYKLMAELKGLAQRARVDT